VLPDANLEMTEPPAYMTIREREGSIIAS